MFTSYYGKCKNHPEAVSISIGKPKGFSGPTAKELCPTWGMVKSGYPYEEYVRLLQLRGVKPTEVLEKYRGKILLCFEKDRSKCHRGYLARWIWEVTGVEVPEWEGEAPKKPDEAQGGLFT